MSCVFHHTEQDDSSGLFLLMLTTDYVEANTIDVKASFQLTELNWGNYSPPVSHTPNL